MAWEWHESTVKATTATRCDHIYCAYIYVIHYTYLLATIYIHLKLLFVTIPADHHWLQEFTAFLVDQGMAEDVPQQYIIRFSQSPLKDGNGHQSHCEKVPGPTEAISFKPRSID